jgi:hypothetical protein
MKQLHLRPRSSLLLGYLMISASTVGLGVPAGGAEDAPDPAVACQKLATLANFPVTPTQITLAKFNPAGTTSAEARPYRRTARCRGSSTSEPAATVFPRSLSE